MASYATELRQDRQVCELVFILYGAKTVSLWFHRLCDILKIQERTCELFDLCTVLCVLFIGFTIQYCWKPVLISSINVSFLQYLNPNIWSCCVVLHCMLTNPYFFGQKLFYFDKKKKTDVEWTNCVTMLLISHWSIFYYSTIIHGSHVLHASIWPQNPLHIIYSVTLIS